MTFYAVSSMTQKVIDWFSWALAEWCRMIKGRLSSIIRKIGQWSLRSQRSNNHYKRTVPKLLPLYLLKFLTNVDELWQDETNIYVFRMCLEWCVYSLYFSDAFALCLIGFFLSLGLVVLKCVLSLWVWLSIINIWMCT